jgi:hypothetical protein
MEAEYRFRFTEEHLLTSLERFQQQLPGIRLFHKYRWLLLAIAVFVLLVATLKRPKLLSIALCVSPVLLVLWLRLLNSWSTRRRFRQSPSYNDDIVICLSETGMRTRSNLGETCINWKAFTKARQFPDGFLLFQGPSVFNWFPNAAAVAPFTVSVALNLVRDQVSDFA